MGLFRKKNEPQAPAGIKLIKRFQFERKHRREGDEYINQTYRTVVALETYSVNGKSYVVRSSYDYEHDFDIRDDHGTTYESMSFTVFPIAEADASDEARVNAELEKHFSGWSCSAPELPEWKVRDDDKLFSEYIMNNIKTAIKNIKASQKIEKLMEGKDNISNAVHVGYDGSAWDTCVYDFGSQYGLGQALSDGASRVSIHDAKAVAELCNMNRALCYYYRSTARSGMAHNVPMSALFDTSLDGDLIICGKNALGKPEALTADEIKKIVDALEEHKKFYQ